MAMDAAVMAAAAQFCADCYSSRPRYVSISLGIWLCNRCYGIHRSVGVHVTRTKCVGLDSWSAQELHRMKSIGNERAASYWESPGPKSTNEEVEKWIRDKYERKLFCPQDLPPRNVSEFQEKSVGSTSAVQSQGQETKFNFPLPKIHLVPPSPNSAIDDDDDEFGSFIQAPS